MFEGVVIKIDYYAEREWLMQEAKKLKELGFKSTDIYRGIGLVLGKLGKIHATGKGLQLYADRKGYLYFLVESYVTGLGLYMVKIRDDEQFVCECPSFLNNIARAACKDGKAGVDCSKITAEERKCKHIAGAIIARDYLRKKMII